MVERGVEESVCCGSHVKRAMTSSDDTDVGGTFFISFNGEVQCTTDSRCVNLYCTSQMTGESLVQVKGE